MWHTKVAVLSVVARDLLSSRHFDFHSFAHLFKVISFRGRLRANILSIRRPPSSFPFPPVGREGVYFLLQIDRRRSLYLCSLKVNSIPTSIFHFFFFLFTFSYFLTDGEDVALFFP